MPPYSPWLHVLAWAYLNLSFACALIIIVHEFRRPQEMFIMNIVWPITALYLGPAGLVGYWRSGQKGTKSHHHQMRQSIEQELRAMPPGRVRQLAGAPGPPPSREQVGVAVSHCGAGCTLGDIVGEWFIFGAGITLTSGELGTRLLLDFLLAWALGVVFQYFTIVPMRGLSFGKGVLQAIRVDTLSIVAFQIGMSVWAVVVYFVLFPAPHLRVTQAVFWFMMQIGMMLGFATSYPVNLFLLKSGWKEKMPQSREQIIRRMAEERCRNLAA